MPAFMGCRHNRFQKIIPDIVNGEARIIAGGRAPRMAVAHVHETLVEVKAHGFGHPAAKLLPLRLGRFGQVQRCGSRACRAITSLIMPGRTFSILANSDTTVSSFEPGPVSI